MIDKIPDRQYYQTQLPLFLIGILFHRKYSGVIKNGLPFALSHMYPEDFAVLTVSVMVVETRDGRIGIGKSYLHS